MSSILTRDALRANGHAPGRWPSLIGTVLDLIAHEIRVRRDLRTLSSLGDSALHDIGLARGGLEEAVRHGRSRAPAPGARDLTAECPLVVSAFTEWR
jgi:uncharacterized protein YjiS (DUF1127 family)